MGRSAGRPATPSQVADLAAARDAQARIQRVSDVGAARWDRVHTVQRRLEQIRRENHLADDLMVIFRGDR